MLKLVLDFFLALVFSVLITPLLKLTAARLGIIDKPGFRKIHNKPVAFMGGVAIYLSLVVTLLVLGGLSRDLVGIGLCGLAFILFGLLDDAGAKMRARYKIGAHLLFAAGLVYFTGLHFNFFAAAWLNWTLTVCFITFMTNSMNMLDGMDGLDSGVAFLASGFFAVLAGNSGQQELMLIALAVMGATLGFLRYNFNHASIFLGEAGSTFLGFILAVLAIKLNIYGLWNVALALQIERIQLISFFVPLIVLGIPIFDTYFVFASRFLHNIKFSQPGQDHSHHRIHLMGFSQRSTVLTLYVIQFVLGLLALAMVRADVQQFFALLAIVAVFFFGFTIVLSQVKVYEQESQR
jgi:UDP-GlcNAc:undecaprenyl-phosphate/decaprenyl-phosphate GlcNAc-1-phosphate transferase